MLHTCMTNKRMITPELYAGRWEILLSIDDQFTLYIEAKIRSRTCVSLIKIWSRCVEILLPFIILRCIHGDAGQRQVRKTIPCAPLTKSGSDGYSTNNR